MNEIIQSLEANATNGKENFCYISENKLKALKELSKREYQENQELKKQFEERPKEYVFIGNAQNKTRDLINQITKDNKELENQQKEFINFLENEKDRLARECSQIYEDSLGKTRLVNEDIFNEVDKVLSKYKEIIGGKGE